MILLNLDSVIGFEDLALEVPSDFRRWAGSNGAFKHCRLVLAKVDVAKAGSEDGGEG